MHSERKGPSLLRAGRPGFPHIISPATCGLLSASPPPVSISTLRTTAPAPGRHNLSPWLALALCSHVPFARPAEQTPIRTRPQALHFTTCPRRSRPQRRRPTSASQVHVCVAAGRAAFPTRYPTKMLMPSRSTPAYQSPLRHHTRAASSTRRVKVRFPPPS